MISQAKCFKVAKGLVEISLDQKGRADEEKIIQVITELKKQPRSKSLPIMRNFLCLINHKINKYEGHLEKSDSTNDSAKIISENISKAKKIQINFKTTENNSLIAGFRLRIGDDVFEDSIANRISRLKKSLN